MKEQYRYSVNTSIGGGGITVSLQRGGHGMELLRHFTLPKEDMAASAYELRLRRVAAGPYYRLDSGERVPLAARGTMTFVAAHRRGQRVTVEARDGAGTVILHVAGRRRSPVPGLVPRPYRIVRKLRKRMKT